jgi:hypothetical protein
MSTRSMRPWESRFTVKRFNCVQPIATGFGRSGGSACGRTSDRSAARTPRWGLGRAAAQWRRPTRRLAHSQATESGGDYAVSNSDNDRASGRQGDCAALARSPILSRYGAALMPDRRIASIENVMADCKRKMKIEDDMADSLEKEFAG